MRFRWELFDGTAQDDGNPRTAARPSNRKGVSFGTWIVRQVLPCALAGQHTIPLEEIVVVLIVPHSRFTGRLSSARITVRERRGDTTRGFCFKPLPVQSPWTDEKETSMSIKALRKHLLELLDGGHAHIDFETAIADLPVEMHGVRPQGLPHTPWRLLEHMRIAQWDILRFSIDPDHISPEFPSG